MKHSKLPWKEENNLIISDVVIVCDICGGLKEETMKANAAFIVKCVNNHEKILGTLKDIEARLNAGQISMTVIDKIIFAAREAIKQAETEK